MKLALTRIGEQSKMVVTGDSSQSDLRQTNGLDDLLLKLNGRDAEYLDFVHLEEDDIQRHPAVKEIVEIYQIDSNFRYSVLILKQEIKIFFSFISGSLNVK